MKTQKLHHYYIASCQPGAGSIRKNKSKSIIYILCNVAYIDWYIDWWIINYGETQLIRELPDAIIKSIRVNETYMNRVKCLSERSSVCPASTINNIRYASRERRAFGRWSKLPSTLYWCKRWSIILDRVPEYLYKAEVSWNFSMRKGASFRLF